MKRLFLAIVAGGASLAAFAQTPAPVAKTPVANTPTQDEADPRILQALRKYNPQARIDYIGDAPLPGFREVLAGGQVVYVSNDGRFLIPGNVYDMEALRDLAASSRGVAAFRREQIASVPREQRIVFSPSNPKYTVSVFTAADCGYCRKLHKDIAEYNKQGIAIEYLAFPRAGLGGQDYKDMVSIWCAADRKQALTKAKAGTPVAAKTCENPVAKEYGVGQRVGVTGTPGIFAADGTSLGGYLTPEQMRARLDKLAAATGPVADGVGR